MMPVAASHNRLQGRLRRLGQHHQPAARQHHEVYRLRCSGPPATLEQFDQQSAGVVPLRRKNDEVSERYSLNSEHISFTSFVLEVDEQKGDRMRHWEYRTLSVHQVSVSFTKTKGWRLKEINEQEQPDWKKTEVYPSIADLCNQMDEQGWELTGVGYQYQTESPTILYFRRA
jgi:hypothetical protein